MAVANPSHREKKRDLRGENQFTTVSSFQTSERKSSRDYRRSLGCSTEKEGKRRGERNANQIDRIEGDVATNVGVLLPLKTICKEAENGGTWGVWHWTVDGIRTRDRSRTKLI